jgi:NhaA family Na+:H+ antiporter
MPVIGALGGMVVPATIYIALNSHGAERGGWGIPIATDIAFVLGLLSLLGSRVPSGLRLFLLAIAIIDDIGAIVVIAVFYSEGIDFGALAEAGGAVVAVVALRRLHVTRPIVYVVPAIVLWASLHQSGVHATIAGVALGLLTPVRRVGDRCVIDDLQRRFHPLSALVVVPLFALANVGVNVRLETLSHASTSRVAWGVLIGLVAGKAAGIAGATLLARRLGVAALPAGLGTRHVIGGAVLGGIGFTVALLVADLTFAGTDRLADAKLAILGASILAGAIGGIVLTYRRSARRVHMDLAKTAGV